MAINATFVADFSSFSAAVNAADVQLRGFEGNANKVSGALNRMVDQFSGRKLIEEATMMARVLGDSASQARLTGNELQQAGNKAAEAVEKMRRLGLEIPAGLEQIATHAKTAGGAFESMKTLATGLAGAFGVVFSVGAVVNFGKELVNSAGALVDMSQKTGNSIEQLQRWAVVGKQANVTLDQFADASFKLGIALEGGDKAVVRAVQRLGLAYEDLRRQSPDEQFNRTVHALEAMVDPQERNRTAVELFGKSWAAIAPAVSKGYSDLAAQAKISSDAQIKAIDDASDAWDRFVTNQKTSITSWLGNVVIAQKEISKLTDEQLKLYHTYVAAADFTKAQEYLLELARLQAKQVDIALPGQQRQASLTKEQEIAAEKFAAAMEELNAVGKGWQGTMATIDGEIVNAVKYYLAAGVSQNALATAYGLTATQVKAVSSAMDDAAKTTKIYADLQEAMWKRSLAIEKEVTAETGKISQARLKLTNDAVLKEFEAQQSLNGSFATQATLMDKLNEAQKQLQATKIAGFSTIAQEAKLMEDFGQALMDAAVAEEKARFAAQGVNEQAAAMPATVDPAASSLISMGTAAQQAAGSFFSMSAELYNAIRAAQLMDEASGRFGHQIFTGTIGGILPPTSIPHFGTGGPVLRDGPIYAHAGEYVLPRGGGGITIQNLNVTQPFGTPSQVAAAVKEALTTDYRLGGNRPPVGG